MAYIALRDFKGDGIDFEPGDPVPEEVLRGNAKHFMVSGGYVAEIPDAVLEASAPPDTTPGAEREGSRQGVNPLLVEPSDGDKVKQEDVQEEARQQHEHDQRVREDLERARNPEDESLKASQRAIELAEENSVLLSDVTPTGTAGNITAADVQNYLRK